MLISQNIFSTYIHLDKVSFSRPLLQFSTKYKKKQKSLLFSETFSSKMLL